VGCWRWRAAHRHGHRPHNPPNFEAGFPQLSFPATRALSHKLPQSPTQIAVIGRNMMQTLQTSCSSTILCPGSISPPWTHTHRYVTLSHVTLHQDLLQIRTLTSSRLLPGSSYSCCIRNLRALVHKQCHPVHITTAHEILQQRIWQLCKSTLPPNHSGSWARKESR
jgi:Tfp pilus assembly protein PilV